MCFQSAIYYLREFFFPLGCGGCGEILLSPADTYYSLCAKCRASFEAVLLFDKRCDYCGKPLISEEGSCLSCRGNGAIENQCYSEQLVRLRVLFQYESKFRSVLGAYKFRKTIALGNFFAGYLEIALDFFQPETLENAAWVPVPPRPGKVKKQGWDQIEFLARRLEYKYKHSGSKKPGLPVCRCLKRLASRSQKELNQKERESNLKGRIRCVKKPPETVFLFDDVITTGATMKTCAAALLEGGAKKVYGVCLFYN